MNRVHNSITARAERIVLIWLANRLPGAISSDFLTMLGVAGAALCFVGYWQSSHGAVYLWLAVFGLALNWFGDSLDGTLARQRKRERPKYGFFLDHMTDTFAMGLIAIGIGLSPYVQLTTGMAALLGYYVLVILSMTTSNATGVFKVSFNGVGPTEVRLFIALCTIAGILFPTPRFTLGTMVLTIYDVIMLVATAMMVVMTVIESTRTLKVLAVEDPPHS